jgi:hypothetical protein
MIDLKQMTSPQLKQYLSEHRTDEDKFSEALSELLSRDPNPTVYPANLPLEELDTILREKIQRTQRSE